jgi:hypothetical protein
MNWLLRMFRPEKPRVRIWLSLYGDNQIVGTARPRLP